MNNFMTKFSEQLGGALKALGEWVAGKPAEGKTGRVLPSSEAKTVVEKREDKMKTVVEQTKNSFAQFEGKEQDPEVIDVLKRLLNSAAEQNSDKFTEAEEKEMEGFTGIFYKIANIKSGGKPMSFGLWSIRYDDRLKVKAEVLTFPE